MFVLSFWILTTASFVSSSQSSCGLSQGGEVVANHQSMTMASTVCPLLPSQQARPRGNPASWIVNEDYPKQTSRVPMAGVVEFRLKVGRNGRPNACEILSSSSFALLDSTTCSIMMRRARFCPATNRKGRPIEGTWSSRVRWMVPAD